MLRRTLQSIGPTRSRSFQEPQKVSRHVGVGHDAQLPDDELDHLLNRKKPMLNPMTKKTANTTNRMIFMVYGLHIRGGPRSPRSSSFFRNAICWITSLMARSAVSRSPSG